MQNSIDRFQVAHAISSLLFLNNEFSVIALTITT